MDKKVSQDKRFFTGIACPVKPSNTCVRIEDIRTVITTYQSGYLDLHYAPRNPLKTKTDTSETGFFENF